jgi:hypothetical protein
MIKPPERAFFVQGVFEPGIAVLTLVFCCDIIILHKGVTMTDKIASIAGFGSTAAVISRGNIIPKNIWRVVDSDEGFEILDSTAATGSDWGEGGCAILAMALKKVIPDGEIIVIYNTKTCLVEHFGLLLNTLVIDYAGVYYSVQSWLAEFKESYSVYDVRVVPFSAKLNIGEIVVDQKASEKLADLIRD